MIRQTLYGLWKILSAVAPFVGLFGPPVVGALLVAYVPWLGIAILAVWAAGFLLVIAYEVGGDQ